METVAHVPSCLYYAQPRSFEVDCIVTSSGTATIAGITPPREDALFWAQLDCTPFFPECGGQPSDWGTLDGIEVLAVTVQNEKILVWTHTVLMPGEKVHASVDIHRCIDFATQHTAQHLLSATILNLFDTQTVSMHLGEDESTIDIVADSFSWKQATQAELLCMQIIEENRPIRIHWCPPENAIDFPLRKTAPTKDLIRIVDIGAFDYSPCCAPHLQSTGLIGLILITAFEKYKGMIRISFTAGQRAAEIAIKSRTAATATSTVLHVPVETIAEAARSTLTKLSQTEHLLIIAKDQLATFEAQQLLTEYGDDLVITAIWNDKTIDDVLRIGRALQKKTDKIIVAASTISLRIVILTSARNVELRKLAQPLLTEFAGKGGGNDSMIQASFSSRQNLEHYIAAFRKNVTTVNKEN